MPKQGENAREYDPEAMFLWWYNHGERRTLLDVKDEFGCGYNTVRRYADEFDWDRRADEIDRQARVKLDREAAGLVAKMRHRELQMLGALEAKFARRLAPSIDGQPNPDELAARDITVADLERVVKLRELLTGGATERVGTDERTRSLAEIEAEIEALELAAMEPPEGGSEDG